MRAEMLTCAAIGVLKGYDQLMNLVLDDVEEILHDPETGNTTDEKRSLGLAVLRGPTITLVSPADGMEMIAKYVTATGAAANRQPFYPSRVVAIAY